jgi:hypothetical protein
MDISSLIDPVVPAVSITERTLERNALWFGRYDHCLRLTIPEISALKSLAHTYIDRTIALRKRWRDRASTTITDEIIHNLHLMCDFLLTVPKKDRRIMIQDSMIYVYTRSRDLAIKLSQLPFITQENKLLLTSICLHGQPDTVILKNPRHCYRSYFKTTKLDPVIARSLRQYLGNQDNIRIGSGFQDWIDLDLVWLRDYYFVDYDHASTIHMLELVAPGVTRKTLPIVRR